MLLAVEKNTFYMETATIIAANTTIIIVITITIIIISINIMNLLKLSV